MPQWGYLFLLYIHVFYLQSLLVLHVHYVHAETSECERIAIVEVVLLELENLFVSPLALLVNLSEQDIRLWGSA